MSSGLPHVLHLVAADTPPGRLIALRLLRADASIQSDVLVVGRTTPAIECLKPDERLTKDPLHSVLPRATQRQKGKNEPGILHVWSEHALLRSGALSEAHLLGPDASEGLSPTPLLVDLDFPDQPARFLRAFADFSALHFVAPGAAYTEQILRAGVRADRCTLIRDAVDFSTLSAARRIDILARFKLDSSDRAVWIVSPVTREAGAFLAAWAALIVDRVIPDIRILLRDEGPEAQRVARLLESCRRADRLRLVGAETPIADMAVAADVAIFTPESAASSFGLAWAMAAGKPIVASAVPSVAELLVHGQNARLCRPQPKDAARRLLAALEDAETSRRLALLAQSQAYHAFGRERMLDEYRAVYGKLAKRVDSSVPPK